MFLTTNLLLAISFFFVDFKAFLQEINLPIYFYLICILFTRHLIFLFIFVVCSASWLIIFFYIFHYLQGERKDKKKHKKDKDDRHGKDAHSDVSDGERGVPGHVNGHDATLAYSRYSAGEQVLFEILKY